jgi:hypothetical protein
MATAGSSGKARAWPERSSNIAENRTGEYAGRQVQQLVLAEYRRPWCREFPWSTLCPRVHRVTPVLPKKRSNRLNLWAQFVVSGLTGDTERRRARETSGKCISVNLSNLLLKIIDGLGCCRWTKMVTLLKPEMRSATDAGNGKN